MVLIHDDVYGIGGHGGAINRPLNKIAADIAVIGVKGYVCPAGKNEVPGLACGHGIRYSIIFHIYGTAAIRGHCQDVV